ncbi:hypothetical protein Moror_5122, partial [Moniliophthora roreri MCA 2997]
MLRTHHQTSSRSTQSPAKKKKQHVRALETFAIMLFADAEEDEEIFSAMIIAYLAWRACQEWRKYGRFGRRGPYNQQKSKDFFDVMIYRFSEHWFRAWMWCTCSMGHNAFWKIHNMIEEDPIFISGPQNPQRPVKYQLTAFLCCIEAETAVKTASVISIAKGSVFNYIEQVLKALCNRCDQHLTWP